MHRRGYLSLLTTGALSGCLRLESQRETRTDEGSPSGNEDVSSRQEISGDITKTASKTDIGTSTEAATTPDIELSKAWSTFFEVVGAPLFSDRAGYFGTRDGIIAVSVTDGSKLWTQQVEQDLGGPFGFAGTLADQYLYFGTTHHVEDNRTGTLYQLNRENGEVLSSMEIGPCGGRPAVTDSHAVIGTDQNLQGASNDLVGIATGQFKQDWSVTAEVDYTDGLGFNGIAYVGFGDGSQPRIEARNPANGSVEWAIDGLLTAPMKSYDNALFLPISSHDTGGVTLHRVDPNSGEVTWRHTLERSRDTDYIYTAPPVFVDNRAYLASYMQVHAIDLETGESVWNVQTESPVAAAPAVLGNLVWVTPTAPAGNEEIERDRQLLGYDAQTGELRLEQTLTVNTIQPFALGDRLGVLMDNQLTAYDVEISE